MNKDCSHKFVGPNACAHCGATVEQVKAAGYDEALKLLHEQSAEVARLREENERVKLLNCIRYRLSQGWARMLDTERAAHEATKAELARVEAYAAQCHDESERWANDVHTACSARQVSDEKLDAAEQRVAKLERDIGAVNNEWQAETMRKLQAEDALSSARDLLETVAEEPVDWWERRAEWLSAHPEPATPAATGAEPDCSYVGRCNSSRCPKHGKEPARMSERRPVWYCKIGRLGVMPLPDGCDLPMRQAVRDAYQRVAGVQADFVFSGWNTELTEPELAVVETQGGRIDGPAR